MAAMRLILQNTKVVDLVQRVLPSNARRTWKNLRQYLNMEVVQRVKNTWERLRGSSDEEEDDEDDYEDEEEEELENLPAAPAGTNAWMRGKLENIEEISDKYILASFKATTDVVKPLNSLVGRKVSVILVLKIDLLIQLL